MNEFKIYHFRILTLIFFIVVTGCVINEKNSTNDERSALSKLACKKIQFDSVFEKPSSFQGKIICGYAYVYLPPKGMRGDIAFFPKINSKYFAENDKFLYLDDSSDSLLIAMKQLPQWTKVYLYGRLEYSKSCWGETLKDEERWFCSPKRPMELFQAEVYLMGVRLL